DISRLLAAPSEGLLGPAPLVEVGAVEGDEQMAGWYDDADSVIIATEEAPVRALLDQLPAGAAVLDAACGRGRHAACLASGGRQVIGVDQSQAMLDVAAQKLPGADLRVGTLERLPVDSGAVDAVVCSLALTHLAD